MYINKMSNGSADVAALGVSVLVSLPFALIGSGMYIFYMAVKAAVYNTPRVVVRSFVQFFSWISFN